MKSTHQAPSHTRGLGSAQSPCVSPIDLPRTSKAVSRVSSCAHQTRCHASGRQREIRRNRSEVYRSPAESKSVDSKPYGTRLSENPRLEASASPPRTSCLFWAHGPQGCLARELRCSRLHACMVARCLPADERQRWWKAPDREGGVSSSAS
jgi:hypothetical protein